MNVLAFALGLISLGLVKADVSHLRQNQHQRTAFNNRGDASYSSQSFDNAGNNPYSKPRYWWMDTETLPMPSFTNDQKNYFSASGCNGCASPKLNIIRHKTPQQHYDYSQNSFTNARQRSLPSFNSIHQTASVSGPPNNFFAAQMFDSGRIQQSSSCSDSNSACVAPKFCFNGFIDQSAQQKAVRSASGRCYAPEICCRFAQRRNAPYNQDNTVSAAESTSEVLTKEGYVVKKPSNQYLPSFPEFNPAPSNDQQTFIRPTQPPRPIQPRPQQPQRPIQPRPTPPPQRPIQPQPTQRPYQPPPTPQRPYQPQPSENRPIEYAPIIVPVGCSAALNCTNIQFCTADGVISKTPVILNPDQELFRVPLTDCRNPITKEVGKCCRDPDYTDPWPVGRTGQYVPEELNNVFDSGAYKPEPSGPLPVRVKVQQEGYVLPQPSNTQQRLYLPPKSNRI